MRPEFTWNRRREQVALFVAEDQLSDADLAKRTGINKATLERWKREPPFRARVQEHVTAFRESIKAEGIANRQNRVDRLNDTWDKLKTVIKERGADAAVKEVPGGKTGLVVRQVKQVGYGDNAQIVEEYAVDVGTLRELRAHEEQAAKELGQWVEKQQHTGEMLIRQYAGIDPDSV